MTEYLFSHYNYFISIILMMAGFYVVTVAGNLIKKLIGMGIFQTSVLLFYISVGQVKGGVAPIIRDTESAVIYTNPIPHVLMLTAIVVGIATVAVGLAIVIRIKDTYGSIEESDILAADEHHMQEGRTQHMEDSDAHEGKRVRRVKRLASLYRPNHGENE